MIGTLLGSSTLLLEGMEQLAFGIQFTPRQRDAYIHLWRVIGFLFGIDDDINPNRGGYEASKIRMESVFAFAIASDPDPDLTWRLSRHICESVTESARTSSICIHVWR